MDHVLLQSLLRPEAYDDIPKSVDFRQTHISYLFLTDLYVYKIKKPVDFGFLNFTSIDRRRFYCEEEVRLNRRLSPEVYLGVVEVRQSPAGAAFTGDGAVIDYAVKMRRLPNERMLDRLVESGDLNDTDILRIASTIAQFHLNAGQSEEITQNGSADSVQQSWIENFSQVAPFVGDAISEKGFAFLREWVTRFLAENRELFAQRVAGGFIRDCDGDLHLANICIGDKVWIFDCIEFNNRFRYIDTASDIAFLLMDLDYHYRRDLARVFLDEYCRLTGDYGCLAVVEFYKIYRAFVRGKVASLFIRDSEVAPEDRAIAQETAKSYFSLARGYVVRHSLPPTLIMVGGMIGSGKSTLAAHLGRELGVEHLSSDRLRKELFSSGMPAEDEYGRGIYSDEADATTYSELLQRAVAILANGESVIVDATFRRVGDRQRFRQGAEEAGVAVCLLMTDTSEQVIIQRLAARKAVPDRFSDGRPELYRAMCDSFDWPDPLQEPYLAVPTSGDVYDGVDTVLTSLGMIA
ncbi:AAA family ATPase [Geobacter pelophilus]|uniref:AAA family ATPase n=1 Tax=Geoanaerobacter pelophilus TaxID=60036 RepID=A0AAW4L1C0_9BACT|nr:AAA family ATPase [Geoanaerobacter pelophilus]MBT0662753.1 AAA family ATPase [Geoanaerobacter pelophilus]